MTAIGEDDELGILLSAGCLLALLRVLSAQHERIQRDAVAERVQSARAAHEHTGAPRGLHRRGIPGGEVHGVHLCQLAPGNVGVVEHRLQPLSERGDRALAGMVDEGHRGTRWLLARCSPHLDAQLTQALHRAAPVLVFAKRRDEHGLAGQAGKLYRRYAAAAGRLLEGSSACTISPAVGMWSTRANVTHSTWPTTATLGWIGCTAAVSHTWDTRACRWV